MNWRHIARRMNSPRPQNSIKTDKILKIELNVKIGSQLSQWSVFPSMMNEYFDVGSFSSLPVHNPRTTLFQCIIWKGDVAPHVNKVVYLEVLVIKSFGTNGCYLLCQWCFEWEPFMSPTIHMAWAPYEQKPKWRKPPPHVLWAGKVH